LSFPRFLSGIHSSNGSPIEAFGDDDIEFAGKRNETLVILMRLPCAYGREGTLGHEKFIADKGTNKGAVVFMNNAG